jgi:amino acid adenylation domain-containing protein
MENRKSMGEMKLAASQYSKERDYWLKKLSGEIVKSHFPYSNPQEGGNKNKNTINNQYEQSRISGELYERLMKLSNHSNAKLHMILLAGVSALLYKYTGIRDIIVGTPIYRQDADGDFINTVLAISNQLTHGITFKELLLQVKQTVVEANENANYPIETLLYQLKMPVTQEEFPLFDTAVLVQDIHDKSYLKGINLNTCFLFSVKERYIETILEYNSSRYHRWLIQGILRHFHRLMQDAIFNINTRVSDMELTSEEDKQELLIDFNNTGVEYPNEKILHKLFEERAAFSPHKTAFVYEDQQFTYQQLNNNINQLASVLRTKGVKPDTVVGIMVENPLWMVVGILGILKAGGGYLPLDSGYPQARLEYIIKNSGSSILLMEKCLQEKVNPVNPLQSIEFVLVDDEKNYTGNGLNLEIINRPKDLAYVIYTSGTTGKPKGVMIAHQNVVNTLLWFGKQFGIQEDTNLLQLTDYTFDPSIEDIFGTFIHGGTLHTAARDVIVNKSLFGKYVESRHIHIIDFIPTMLKELLCHQPALKSLRAVIAGGEKLEESVKNQIIEKGYMLYNNYGPTEISIDALSGICSSQEKVTLGKPISNTRCYVLTAENRLAPIGVPGELTISGRGLARGYINDPELTNQKFTNHLFFLSEKMYRTGDRVKWLPGGDIEFLGRIDNQVKVRGFRIELEDIESHLLNHEEVQEAVVVHKSHGSGDKSLHAYIVLSKDLDIHGVRNYLSGVLPDYMIPAYFTRLEEMPRTPTGKIDRKALPEDEISLSGDYIAPSDEIHRKLVKLWAKILGVKEENIGINNNFFELGGHSLKATVLLSQIHKELDVKVPLSEVFKSPTISELTEFIKQIAKSKFESIEAAELKEFYLLSPAQKRLYILQEMDVEATNYNIPLILILKGPLDKRKLENCLNTFMDRHESLRTSFHMVNDLPVQRINSEVTFALGYNEAEEEASEGIFKDFVRPFNLEEAPLFRAFLIRTGKEKHILMLDIHHIITDGVSMDIFVEELMGLYGGKELPPVGPRYKDFSEWQNKLIESEEIRKQEDHWRKRFDGNIPVLDLPVDYPRAVVQSLKGNTLDFEISREHSIALNSLALREGATVYMVVLAVYTIFLKKITLQEDIVVGTPIAGRRHTDLQQVMGMFVNMLALRNYPEGELPFTEFLNHTRKRTLEDFKNQDYQFEDLVEKLAVPRDTGRNPLFDTAFSFHNESRFGDGPGMKIPQLEITPHHDFENSSAKFDLTLHSFEDGENLKYFFEYSTALFKKESIERFITYFKTLITSVIDNPGEKIANLEVIPQPEKERLLYDFNDTDAGYPVDKTIHQLFDQQVEKTPANEAVAFIDADTRQRTSLTYKELNEKANRLALVLRRKGVKAGTIAAVLLERSIEMVTALLAILKAGGAYLPIEPDTPVKRISAMLEDSQPVIVLTRGSIVEKGSFAALKGLGQADGRLYVSQLQPRIEDFDSIPFPDRSLVNYEKYNRFIGQAMVKNSIALQTTRGCPYHCLYCHKIWSKRHIERSAENTFAEIRLYYDMGVRRFVIIDDIFNLDIKNSSELFKLIIENGLQLQLFFPNGLRGDLLTREYIDLMVEAGTVSLALALETASPRLQNLVKKNLNLHRLKENLQYFCEKYPHVILELFTMHGFPTETEQEAIMTLDFIKDLKWLHFPYIHILKIYPNTDMEKLALDNGISTKAIAHSSDLAYHELPETLPFDKSFTLKYQADFLNSYFLSKERLLSVLPHQIKVLTEDELVQKYNSYLPTEIESFSDLLEAVGITREELNPGAFCREDSMWVPDLNRKIEAAFPASPVKHEALKVLLLDLSQFFSHGSGMLYDVVEPPLGLMYVQTYLNRKLGSRVEGRIAKSRIDFDNYEQLKSLLDEFKPDVIGMRTLTFYKDFFHQTATMIRQWGFDGPVIAGGPYATSDYQTLLQDRSIDLVVLSEGETITANLVEKIIENNGKLPDTQVLKEIPGIAFVPVEEERGREILMLDALDDALAAESGDNPGYINSSTDLAYIIYTSGSTGKPKGSLIEHKNVVRLMVNDEFLFDFNSRDVWTMFHSYCFDFSVWEMYGALLYGGKLVVVPKMIARDPREYLDTLKSEGVTVLNQTPSAFYNLSAEMLSQPAVNLEVRYIIFGGEALKPGQLRGWRTRYPETALVNMYGITETTVHVTFKEIGNAEIESNISNIGKPIPTLRIYILDRHLKPVPIGVGGEMFVGGDGVCRGYLNRPELTAEKFIHVNNDKLYKTGDLAKWTESGDMEYLGRVDQQVKIRGFRIEPAEIERYLSNHPDISKAIIIAGEAVIKSETGENRDKYLCAYILSDQSLEVPELRQYLALEFPDYMIPSYFIMVDEIPLTVNGKVDIKRLPAPGVTTNEDSIAPRDDIEEKLVNVWSEVLGIETENIGIDDNFFEMGGHSLKATVMISKIHKLFNVKVPLAKVFTAPTIKELAEYFKTAVRDKFTAIEPVEKKDFYPLSSPQRKLYILQQMDKKDTSYNVSVAVVLEGNTDIGKIKDTFIKLINRHEILRTSFEMIGVHPVQRIHDEVELELEHLEANSQEIKILIMNFIKPFNMDKAPLLRVGFIEGANILIVDMHHIVTDEVSMAVLTKDFAAFYNDTHLLALKIQYKDYSEWEYSAQEKKLFSKQEAYWLKMFAGEIPVLNLPTDYPRPETRQWQGQSVFFEIDEERVQDLRRLANERNTTLYVVLLTIFNVLLLRYTGQEDIVVGTPAAGRRHADLENIIGMFVNTIAMRNFPSPEQGFADFLDQVIENSIKAFENQDYQLDALIQSLNLSRTTNRNPLFDVAFELKTLKGPFISESDNEPNRQLKLKPYEVDWGIANFDISLLAFEREEGIDMCIEYVNELFEKETVEKMVQHFLNIINVVTADTHIKISQIKMISEDFDDNPEYSEFIEANFDIQLGGAYEEKK